MSGSLFLIGPRGSGKTTVGRLVAQHLGIPFYDADEALEADAGRSIRAIIVEEGEPAFRDREEQILGKLIERGPAVIATGGGVVGRDSNRRKIKMTGKAVWLTADADTLLQRLTADSATADRRPNLSVGGRAEIEELLRLREPLYRECANLIVETAGRSPDQIAADILVAWSISSSNTA
jgi:shikimate kinase